jgi:hypothetical protein
MDWLGASALLLFGLYLLRGMHLLGVPWSVSWRSSLLVMAGLVIFWPTVVGMILSPPILWVLLVTCFVVGLMLARRYIRRLP